MIAARSIVYTMDGMRLSACREVPPMPEWSKNGLIIEDSFDARVSGANYHGTEHVACSVISDDTD